VFPLVEASEQLRQVRDATQTAEKMRQTMFKDFGVGLVHGRLAADDRDAIMRSFRDGKVGILVATTVIEVGIDVPNATIMVVEHAERFGLSQLHQLRAGSVAAPRRVIACWSIAAPEAQSQRSDSGSWKRSMTASRSRKQI